MVAFGDMLIVFALAIIGVFLLYDNIEKIKIKYHEGYLGDLESAIVRRLIHVSILIPAVLVVSTVFGFFGYEIKVIEQIIMAFVVSFVVVTEEEIRERLQREGVLQRA